MAVPASRSCASTYLSHHHTLFDIWLFSRFNLARNLTHGTMDRTHRLVRCTAGYCSNFHTWILQFGHLYSISYLPPFWVQFGRILTSKTWWRTHSPADCVPRPWLNLLALVQGFELLFFMLFSLLFLSPISLTSTWTTQQQIHLPANCMLPHCFNLLT
jgi:hypothetical protein